MRDLGNALERFSEMLEVTTDDRDYALDATIQRFEFSFELFWKTLKLLLENEAGVEANGPKPVLIAAYTQKWIDDEKKWIDLLKARNLTSHVYNEQRAHEIYELIQRNGPMMIATYGALKVRFKNYVD